MMKMYLTEKPKYKVEIVTEKVFSSFSVLVTKNQKKVFFMFHKVHTKKRI